MSPGPWLLLAAALLVMSFILLTPAVGRMMSKAFPNDPFASLDAPGTRVSGPVHFKASMPLELRAGAEGQGRLSRYRVVAASTIRFVPRHFSVFHDQGWPCAPVQGTITVVPNGVDARVVSTGPRWPRPLERLAGFVLFPVVLPLYLLQRKALAAQVVDIIDVVTADASHATEHAP